MSQARGRSGGALASARTHDDLPRLARALPRPPARLPALLAIVALAASACGPAREDDLYGMTLDVRSQQPWASDPAFRARLHVLLEDSCAHIGLDPSLLYGWTLRIEDDEISCGAVARARGCTWRDEGVVAVSTLAWASWEPLVACVEDTPLPHELLHVKLGDPTHSDARWSDPSYWEPLWSRVERVDCSGDPPSLIW